LAAVVFGDRDRGAGGFERRDEIDQADGQLAALAQRGVEGIRSDGAVRHVAGAVLREDRRLVHPLQQVAEAIDDDLVRHDQHALARILARHCVEDAAQAQDDVAPALAAGRAEIEFADVVALLMKLGIFLGDAAHGQAVEDAELLFAQAFVGMDGQQLVAVQALHQDVGRLGRAHVRRMEHDVRLAVRRQRGEPARQCLRLTHAQLGQGHVDVALGDVDEQAGRGFGRVTCDVAGALAMPDEPDFLRPLLIHHPTVCDFDMKRS
jgi:hypothetical protein